jgi:uncharacterized membrane protein
MGLRNHKFLSFWIILIGAFLLRLNRLGDQALWLDEAWTWAATKLSVTDFWTLSQFDPHPPLYYILLKGWLFTLLDTEFALRLPSVIFSTLSLAALMTIGTVWWGKNAGLYAGLLFSLSSFDVYYSQEARMYTLLALLWLLAYIAIIQSIDGQRRFVVLWGFLNIGLAWTHFYGLLAVGSHLFCATGYLLFYYLRHKRPPTNYLLVLTTMVGVLLAISPVFSLVWNFRNAGPGGAWIPSLQDLFSLFSLWTAGLSSARIYFLDSKNLVFPFLINISPLVWLILGILFFGFTTIWGVVTTWRLGATQRARVIISIILLLLPVAAAYGYAKLTQSRLWAFKPALGNAYLLYLWAGAGLAAIPSLWARRGILLGVGLLAVTSFVPYFSLWQKSNASQALDTLPSPASSALILIQPGYLAPLASYYLDPGIPLWGFPATDNTTDSLRPLFKGRDLLHIPQPVSCAEIPLEGVTNVIIYGNSKAILQDAIPTCLMNKDFWAYEETGWELLNAK